MTRRWLVVATAVWLATSATARAEDASLLQRAHESFLAGERAFNEGRYAEALQLLLASFAMSARPQLLLSLAQTARKLGRYDDAIGYCERYLATNPPPAMARSARSFLQQLRSERAAAPDKEPAKPAPSAEPSDAVRPPAPPAVLAALAPAAAPVDPAPARRQRALIVGLAIGGAVVAAGVAVTLGVLLSSPSDRYPDSALGTVQLAR